MNRIYSNTGARDWRAENFWHALWKATPAYLFVNGARHALAARKAG